MPAASVPVVAEHPDVADQTRAPSLLERMASLMSETRAREWIAAGRVVVDGKIAADPERATPRDHRWYISAE